MRPCRMLGESIALMVIRAVTRGIGIKEKSPVETRSTGLVVRFREDLLDDDVFYVLFLFFI